MVAVIIIIVSGILDVGVMRLPRDNEQLSPGSPWWCNLSNLVLFSDEMQNNFGSEWSYYTPKSLVNFRKMLNSGFSKEIDLE